MVVHHQLDLADQLLTSYIPVHPPVFLRPSCPACSTEASRLPSLPAAISHCSLTPAPSYLPPPSSRPLSACIMKKQVVGGGGHRSTAPRLPLHWKRLAPPARSSLRHRHPTGAPPANSPLLNRPRTQRQKKDRHVRRQRDE